jgi:hypothetical protein
MNHSLVFPRRISCAWVVAALAASYALPGQVFAADLTKAPNQPTPCSFGAFVKETDRAGLNVRRAPTAKSKLLGTLPPVLTTAELGTFRVKIDVDVSAGQQGWFQVSGARDNTALTGRPARQAYTGLGWVSGNKLTAKSQARQGYTSPDDRAAVALRMRDGSGFDSDPVVDASRLIHCQGDWALLEITTSDLPDDLRLLVQPTPDASPGLPAGRYRAWFNELCAIQETSCSGLAKPPLAVKLP